MSRATPVIYRIFDAFFRHIWLFLIALIVVSSVTMTALYLRSQTFHADALTQVVTEDVASELGVKQNDSWVSPAQRNVDHMNDLLNDDSQGGFVDTVLKKANLDQPINLDPSAQDPRWVQLRKNLYVAPESQTTYAIGLTWDRQDECRRIVGAFRARYIREVGSERSANSTATGSFLNSQIELYRKRLLAAEQLLIKYRTSNLEQLPETQSAAISQLSSLQAQMDNLRISQHDSAMKRQALVQRVAQVRPMSILEQATTESPLVTQVKQLEARRDAMLAGNMLPQHPLVAALTDQINALQTQLQAKEKSGASEAKGAVSTKLQDNPEYQSLQSQLLDATIAQQTQQAQVKLLAQEIATYTAKVQQIPTSQRDLTNKTRDYTVVKTEYESLLQRREEVNMKGSLDNLSASSALAPIGQVYAQPTTGKTKRVMMLVGSLLLGLLVGLIAVVLSEWSDRSLRYVADAQRLLGVPVLGTVPETRALTAPRLAASKTPRTLPAPGGGA